MIIRALSLAGGLAGAAGLSQFPEFSQQYLQRLAGQVDALNIVVADFDASANSAGLSRAAALEELAGSAFLAGRHDDMSRTFNRYDRLSADLGQLRAATPLQRLAMPQRLNDKELLAQTWGDFAPAMPVTTAGAVAAGLGYFFGWLSIGGLIAAGAFCLRRLRRTKSAQ